MNLPPALGILVAIGFVLLVVGTIVSTLRVAGRRALVVAMGSVVVGIALVLVSKWQGDNLTLLLWGAVLFTWPVYVLPPYSWWRKRRRGPPPDSDGWVE